VVLVDTSVWVDHLRARDADLAALLEDGLVLMHAFVIGEIACGYLRDRKRVLDLLSHLPSASAATDPEVLRFIEVHELSGKGIGYLDAHLLASVRLAADAALWTRDRRLNLVARDLGLAFSR
jgi:predicted nucleic acid-binding protein